jgi:hypothetical protein
MKGEHKLRLIRPDAAPESPDEGLDGAFEGEPVPSEEELTEAEALRAALEGGHDPLADALRAAFAPQPLDDGAHNALLARALSGADTAGEEHATPSERAGAERLRHALEEPPSAGQGGVSLADLARALGSAHRPRGIDPLRNEALVVRALSRAPARRRAGRVVPVVTAAIVSITAMAAGIALVMRDSAGPNELSAAAAPSLHRSRSAADLFDSATPFPRAGGESARVDRIASARASDLRANRFAAWGVR